MLAALIANMIGKERRELCFKNGSCTHPDLKWSDKLAQECTAYAKQLIDRNAFEHSGAEDVGENLYMGVNQGSLSAATRCWLAEEKYYHGQPIDGGLTKYGHYTQCVWPGSREVGIGMAERTGGRIVVVARYSPAGNYCGQSAWAA